MSDKKRSYFHVSNKYGVDVSAKAPWSMTEEQWTAWWELHTAAEKLSKLVLRQEGKDKK